MKFNVLVAIIATLSLSAAYAQETATPTSGVVVINSNTSATTAQSAAQQPATVVEAAPVQDSKADLMRKARQGEEVKTEQRIVEKLEESRLKEEQQRAERLFGNKLDTPAQAKTEEVKAEKAEVKEVAPTVTIQKVEIVQPAPAVVATKEEKSEEASEGKLSLKQEAKQEEVKTDRFFVGALLAAPNYNASNVKTNYGVGVTAGINLASDFVIEGSFLFSNHSVDSFWAPAYLFKDMDQYDVSAAAKYYILSGRLKPYLGGSITYIKRVYTDRVYNWNGGSQALNWGSQDTDAVNMGLLGGVDFEISKQILIGAGIDYNFNVMNKNEFRNMYNQFGMNNVRPLEEIDYYTLKVGAKFLF